MNDLQREFEQAAADIKQLLHERPDNDTLLRLYALYKQGNGGDVHGCDPGFFDFIGTAKKEAWTLLKGMSQDEARRQYIALVRQLLT
ncbi:acyl-CoA-binding protein [Dyella caseinilytica]|uniref:Acyl-CoA-binding protein n=1 Tax=Dyella caseinilytica TaxID=1849581 RepID=A0ABX7GY57_9GAMM|nr:acyl-CoA-binding protein [Dyella caseinilytica]QRN55421.1 acyl-CoA-binding protein [Dyella caseinilytica]